MPAGMGGLEIKGVKEEEGRVAVRTREVAIIAWNILRAVMSMASQPSLSSRGHLSSSGFRPALCELTGVQRRLGDGWLKPESRKGQL